MILYVDYLLNAIISDMSGYIEHIKINFTCLIFTFLMSLLEVFKSHMWFALYFY